MAMKEKIIKIIKLDNKYYVSISDDSTKPAAIVAQFYDQTFLNLFLKSLKTYEDYNSYEIVYDD